LHEDHISWYKWVSA
jgi:hypothetical protein